VVVSATTPEQQVHRLTLDQLGATPVPNPAVIIIGDVAAQSVLNGLPLERVGHPSAQPNPDPPHDPMAARLPQGTP